MPNPCFDEIVRQSGLSEVFAADTITRALARVGLTPEQVKPADIPRVLPHLERALRIFLPKDELPARLAAIQKLSASSTSVR